MEVVKEDGTTELRGNDILLCLPDGDDTTSRATGAFASRRLRDTASEPTGIIFTGSGETSTSALQHRTGVGALLKISGFDVKKNPRWRDHDDDWWPWGWGKTWGHR